jgi:ATP-binding protein involved in chromosome partitioning
MATLREVEGRAASLPAYPTRVKSATGCGFSLWHNERSSPLWSAAFMPSPNEARVRAIVGAIVDPHVGADLAAADAVRAVGVDGARVSVDIQLGYPALSWQAALSAQVKAALEAEPGIESASVSVSSRVRAHRVQDKLTPLPGVKNIIAVASGKGGVGKSTVAANLALALAAEGASVGVLDADIYGPSQVRMLGLEGKPESPDGRHIEPKRSHGLQAMSIGLMVGEDTPMIWRGPMVTQALLQLLNDTQWDDLDYLVIDLPPGTGDIQLTLAQKVPVSGAVIVTTPQDIALIDAKKALKMFEKVEVPVLGIVENMATHVCSNCGHEEHVFGAGGGMRMAEEYHVPLLGTLPLDIRIREQADGGTPTVAAMPESDLAARYREIARHAAGRLSLQAKNKAIGFPKIVVQNS